MGKFEIIGTKRLLLREPNTDDFPRLYEMLIDPVGRKFTGGVTLLDFDARKAVFEDQCRAFGKDGNYEFSVIEKESGLYVGYCGFQHNTSFDANELLYGFRREVWGKGYATEAAKAAVRFAYENLGYSEIIATSDSENAASVHILKKLGFTYRGLVTDDKNGGEMEFYRLVLPAR